MAARPASRGAAAPVAPRPPRVRDFSGTRPSSLSVSFDVRTTFDFVFSLSDDAGSTDDLPQSDRRWLDDGRTRLRTLFGESVDLYGQELCIVMAALAVDRPEVRDAAAFVDLVGTVDDQTIIKTMLGEELRRSETHDLVERALAGDHDAVVELAEIAAEGHPGTQRSEFAIRLFERPESVLGPTRGILASWLDHFVQVEDRVRAMIERDVQLRAEDRAHLSPHDLIEKTTGGIRFGSEPAVVRVILAPSYFSRPYNFLLGADDWRLYGYPISDAALDSADPLAPPLQVVRLHRALGDDTRLRILRLLRDRDLYLTEIAQLLELSKPTIKHHLAQLRSAGLVTVTEEAGLTYYSLRRDRLDAASSELKRFLLD